MVSKFFSFLFHSANENGQNNTMGNGSPDIRENERELQKIQQLLSAWRGDHWHLAIQLSREDLLQCLIQGSESKYGKLLGIQFEFKKTDAKGKFTIPMDHIEVFQIYYNEGKKRPFMKIGKNEGGNKGVISIDNASVLKIITLDKEYEIEDDKIATRQKWRLHDFPAQGSIPNVYKYFDHFNENAGAVYFTVDQFHHLCSHYEKIILSGASVNFGKKLSQGNADKEIDYFDNYFTLKMEGIERRDLPENTEKGFDPIAAEGADVVIAASCPPAWNAFSKILLQVDNINSEVEKRDLYKNYKKIFRDSPSKRSITNVFAKSNGSTVL